MPTSGTSSRTRRMNRSVNFLGSEHITRVIARAIACSIALLVLPSCGIPPLRRADLAPAMPETFNGVASPENSSLLGIDENQVYEIDGLVVEVVEVVVEVVELVLVVVVVVAAVVVVGGSVVVVDG